MPSAGDAVAQGRQRDWHAFPVLTTILLDDDRVRVATEPDSTGRPLWVEFDPAKNAWSRPTHGDVAPPGDSLAGVRVFDGSLFDRYTSATEIPLGDGFMLARRDTGTALVRVSDGADLGWPRVTETDVDDWAGQVRLGLPRDYPADRLRLLLMQDRLRNEPGPTIRAGALRWFAIAGGFTGGEGQLGGLVAFDSETGRFTVTRHDLLVDATVTRLYAHKDALWIGTARYGPTSIEGGNGLVLYRPARREWRQFSVRNSRIAGDIVWDMAGDDRSLWVATNEGMSRYDLARKLWSSWYWNAMKNGPGYELRNRPPGDLAEELIK